MLKPNRYRIKDKRIKIFREDETETGTIKEYIIPQNEYIKAYARQLSAGERIDAEGIKDGSSYEFVIHKRDLQADMFIEFDKGFGEKTYKIDALDNLEFYVGEMYIRATEINTKEYDETRWA